MRSTWFDKHPALTASAVSIVGAILLLLAMEALLRWFAPSINFRGTEARLFVVRTFLDTHGNARNFDGQVFGAPVHIDADGFRADLATPMPGDSGPTVVFVGDSITFGVGVADGKTFVDLVRRSVPRRRVINASSIGYFMQSYENVVRAFVVPARERLQIGKVVLGICLNDVTRTQLPEFDAQDMKERLVAATDRESSEPAKRYGMIPVWINETFPAINGYLRSHSRLFLLMRSLALDSGRAHLEAAIVTYKDPQVLKRSLDALGAIAMELRRAGISLDVLLFPYEYQLRADTPEIYMPQRLLAQFLSAQKVRHFDLAQEFRTDMATQGRKAADYYLFDDPMHFSELGHAVVYRFIARNGIADP